MAQFYLRLARIVIRFFPILLVYLRDRRRFLLLGSSRRVSTETHQQRAQQLRETMLDLGPTFIKIGQVLSIRPDLVPKLYREELAKLQDTVPPGASGDPEQVLEAEFEELPFKNVTELAGGSLAYVYHARYKGKEVAIKVRRPGVKEQIETDLRVLHVLLPGVVYFVPEQYEYSIRNLADDFERVIFEELDFVREAQVMTEIREAFEGDERVRIPDGYPEVSSERVLTMEYLEGIKITAVERLEAEGFDPDEYAQRILHVYLEMGLEHGVFQADPHPGNLAVNEEGQLVIYDFGMSGRLDSEMRERILDLYRSIAERNVDRMIDILIDLNVLDPAADRPEVRRVLRLFIYELEGQEGLTWRDIVSELGRMFHDFPFRIPPNVMLLIRVGTVGEGLCRQLDPEFDFISEVRSYLRKRSHLHRGARAVFEEHRKDIQAALEATVRLPRRLEEALERMETAHERRADVRREQAHTLGQYVALALITSALFVTSVFLLSINRLYGLMGFTVALVLVTLLVRLSSERG